MKKMPKWAGVLIIGLIVAGALYQFSKMPRYVEGTWRYKMTVEVETPEGVKAGSTVREIKGVVTETKSGKAGSTNYKLKGEAVVIDLGDRGVVFALMRGDYGRNIVYDAFPFKGPVTPKGVRHYRALKARPKELPENLYPMFVRFRDPADPKTVENLLEYEPCADENGTPHNAACLVNDRFTEAFGSGVQLKSVTIEMTEEPVTIGVVKNYLPWLNNIKGYIDGKFAGGGPELSNILDKGDFLRSSK